MTRPIAIGFMLVAVSVALAPLQLYSIFVMKIMCFALFAAGFNLLLGFAGLLSLGHAMFFGSAAYVCGYLVKVAGLSPELGIVVAVAFSCLLGAATGWLSIRRQGIFFAMATLAFSQLVYFICLRLPQTGGENGMQAIPRGYLFGLINLDDPAYLYVFVSAVFLLGLLALHRIIHSPFGAVLVAVRENEPRAISLGYSTDRYKLVAFVISAAFAGLAGATKVFVFQLASLTDVYWTMSGEVVLMVLFGGIGTFFGPVVGALVMLTIEELLAERAGAWVGFIQGIAFIACVLLFKRGIVGVLARRLKLSI